MDMTCQFCRVEHRVGTVPTVHTNGTSAHELRDGLKAALDALHEAQRLMCLASPNGRDYYPQGGLGELTAMNEHERRRTELNRMLRELELQRDHVENVINFMEQDREQRLARSVKAATGATEVTVITKEAR